MRPRSDARRNRARLLDAAEAVFDELGTGAPTAAVAARAGVGIGTVFRHFPTKDDLLVAVYRRHVEVLADLAEEYARRPDPGAAFFELLQVVTTGAERKNRFADAVESLGRSPREVGAPHGPRLRGALAALLTAAQQEGAVRPDADTGLVVAVLVAAGRTPTVEGVSREQLAAVLVDGLRPRQTYSGSH